MKRMCFGTMLNLIYQSRARNTERVRSICDVIFTAYGLNINNYFNALPSHLKNGYDDVPMDLVTKARSININEVSDSIKKNLLPLISDDKHKCLFRAIKQILREDISIPDTKIIGVIKGFEKKNILDSSSFYEAMSLTNFITYSITITNNKFHSDINEIGTNYVDSFNNSDEKIEFISEKNDNDNISPLKRTLNDSSFDNIFKKAFCINISSLSDPTTASAYYIEPSNCSFVFKPLKNFIINNVSNYIFSRAKTRQIVDIAGDSKAVGSQAMLKFVQACGKNTETVLGELLLYIFLEQALDAPKIMSKIELDQSNRNIISTSDGIHLLSINKSNALFHQLVFGASNITGNLNDAVDRAFEKIIAIKDNRENEFRIIDNTIQWSIYDPEVMEYMVNLMIPKRNDYNTPDMAFGIFLGYTIKLDREVTGSQEYRIAIKEQLQKDIQNIQSYIETKIKDNKLIGYSFYFYLFPFNDADNEKTSIIQEMLSGD